MLCDVSHEIRLPENRTHQKTNIHNTCKLSGDEGDAKELYDSGPFE